MGAASAVGLEPLLQMLVGTDLFIRFVARYDGSFPGSYYIGHCGPKTGSASGFPQKYKARILSRTVVETRLL